MSAASPPVKVDFQRDVRPILSDRCFKCHGPDVEKRKAALRLDVRADALKPAKSGDVAIVPGKPEASEMVARIFSMDEKELMPPPEMKKPLSDEQKEVMKRWIAEGAEYQPHWAYVKPVTPTTPAVKQAAWVRNPIDAFVLAKLEARGLAPAPAASAQTLARRVALDLTGLPPSAEALETFTRNPTDKGYEKLVDTLLSSPHYGERWARRWLDLARYADTNGYEKDRERSIWPYRDWVVRALNADLPFDQFTIDQIAGDLRPKATPDQIIATGVHRNTMLNEEGGIDPLEFRFNAMVDRVGTTATTWLGLTMQCCQCHTHKYDPILHTEFYGVMAFLNNADEPDYDLPDATAARQRLSNLKKADELLVKMPDAFPGGRPAADKAFATWLAERRKAAVAWTSLKPLDARSNMPLLTVQPDNSILGAGDITKSDVYDLTFKLAQKNVTAIRLEALPDDSLPGHGPGMSYYEEPKGNFFLGEFQVMAGGRPVKFVSATESYWKNNFGTNPANALLSVDGDPQTGWCCAGRYGQPDEAVFVPDAPIAAGDLKIKMLMGRHFAASLGHFRISVTTDSKPAVAQDLEDNLSRLLTIRDSQLTPADRGTLFNAFLLKAPQVEQAAEEIKRLRAPLPAVTTLVMHERPANHPRPTFRHHRGEYAQPKEQVEPVTLSVLHPFPDNLPRNRLGFAKWLASADNPITPRVVMNRQWAALFGTGIVKTLQDFGYQGELPSHPELLDWLASEFVRQKWSMKAMHKLMVMSSTYRQASEAVPADADPNNRLLSHFPRTRLDAEIIRDAMLSASGLLADKLGGPSVFPPQPEGVMEATYGKAKWEASTGADRYRRSLYTFMKRTTPFALSTTFDGPTGEACLAVRETSNNPMQALAALNDVVVNEAAQALGRSLGALAGGDEARTAQLFQKTLSRTPDADERRLIIQFVKAQRARLSSGELEAAKIGGGPERTVEVAAWTLAARSMFNLDEFLTKG
ncbi:MAG: Planctomycete cytochrome [Verrucomicrobiaceae bacterium]|nr:Planctomycete cytochrome [Verrucomicrobiaceae bacterium]